MKPILVAVIVTALAVSGLGFYFYTRSSSQYTAKLLEVEEQASSARQDAIGYTKFTDYLSVGKKSMSEQAKFIASTVVREYVMTEHVHKDMVIFKSDGIAAIRYSVEYSFGFDLSPSSFDIKATPKGIELTVSKPMLVASPSVKPLSHDFPSVGFATDEKAALIELMKRLPDLAAKQGKGMVEEPAIQALCEKKLIEFLRGFLEKQPGVKMVPNIAVVYRK